jgi:hypothetical protein
MEHIPNTSGFNNHMCRVPDDHFALNVIEHIIKGANVRKVCLLRPKVLRFGCLLFTQT